jgi:hypothetical protein
LSVIKENKEEGRRFTKEEILQFRKKIADKGFFQKLQLEVQEATNQLCRTRLGGHSSYEYLMSLKDSELGSPTRKFLKHNAEFRDYLA